MPSIEKEYMSIKRRNAYAIKTDPLIAESHIKRLLGEDEEADNLEIRALTLREKIQAEYPYPVDNTKE